MAESRARRLLCDGRLLLLLAVVAAVPAFLGPLAAYDVWWHVKAGRMILESGGVPHTVRAGPDGALILDIFAPPRDEYRTAGSGFGDGQQQGGHGVLILTCKTFLLIWARNFII